MLSSQRSPTMRTLRGTSRTCAARGGLPRHFDTSLMSLGLLANCLELGDARVRLTVAATLVPPTVPGGTLVPLQP